MSAAKNTFWNYWKADKYHQLPIPAAKRIHSAICWASELKSEEYLEQQKKQQPSDRNDPKLNLITKVNLENVAKHSEIARARWRSSQKQIAKLYSDLK